MKTTMKKSVARLITLALVLVMVMSLAVPAMAADIKAAKGFDEVPQGVFKFYQTWKGEIVPTGTAFLINEDHIITAGHCVRESKAYMEVFAWLLGLDTGDVKEAYYDNVGFEVAIRRDVTVKAELVTYSEDMDFAILKLDQPVATRKYLTLRDCSELKAGDLVWTVGFPSFFENQSYDNDYTPSGVTVKPGSVTKAMALTEYEADSYHFKGDALSTNVALSGGDSGGPMVDKDGFVVGISISSTSGSQQSEAFYQATAINQVMALCDDLGIEYHTNKEATPEPTVAPTEAPVVETVAPTVAPTEAPVVETQAPVVVETQAPTQPVIVEEPDDPGINMTTILIVAAIAVVAVIVVIVVVMGKNKKQPAQPVYTDTLNRGQTSTMGAGETTVLSGDAGATTVLTRGGSLIRKRTGETIMVNSERFIIGRERKTSNYCIADNSSISRSHVTLIARGGVTYLMDMNAANGTYVNGVKVMANQEVALKNGDIIKLSDEEFEFRV